MNCKKIVFIRGLLTFFFLYLLGVQVNGQIISQSDSTLIKKQTEFEKWKYGMFLHFNMGTFADKEWATGYEDPLLFNPSNLDCQQWTKVIKSAGMDYAVLTVKHTGGWCLWDSKYTNHDITAFKNFKDGKGDIVREYVEACRKEKIKVGLYYCLPGDFSNAYGNSLLPDQKDLHGLPAEAEGDYEGFIEKQISELLTNYGPIDLMWFDQYSNKYTGQYWLQLKAFIHKLQPNCIVLANNAGNYQNSDIISYEYPWRKQVNPDKAVPPPENNHVAELSDCIDAGGRWFWHTGEINLQKVDVLSDMIKLCNSRHTNFLLDVPPGRDGLIGDIYIKDLMAIKKIVFPLKEDKIDITNKQIMKRFGQIIGVDPVQFEKYKKYHSAVWPEVLAMIKSCNIRNYSIFHKDGLLFAYMEYTGTDFKADMARMAADPKTQEWWAIMMPMQQPVANRAQGEWWADMEEVFHLD